MIGNLRYLNVGNSKMFEACTMFRCVVGSDMKTIAIYAGIDAMRT
jgi:hypothetical protein